MGNSNMIEKFIELYGGSSRDIRIFHAPGRVNLIGEHTDYNGGYVFPCALDFGTYALARKRSGGMMRFASENFKLRAEIDGKDIVYKKEHGWVNYPKGVIKQFAESGFSADGFDVLYYGEIPNGAGLSSSASIELVTAVMLTGIFDLDIDMMDLVVMSQRAENKFVGVNCGIMDQFAIGMGKKGHAVLLNCGSMEYEHIPLKVDGYSIVISNTNKKRELGDSKYNERRVECEKAVFCLRRELSIQNLSEVDTDLFERYKNLIDDETVLKRASHVVYENSRVLESVKKLKNGDLQGFGRLMNGSHISLRDLYDVTGYELDTLVEEAWKIDGVIGSRMTGAGFGGCTVSMVKTDAIERFKEQAGLNYCKKTGLKADFYTALPGDGAREITGEDIEALYN